MLAVTALIVAVLGWQTPAMAHGVQHAIRAHGNQLVRAATRT